VATRGGVPRALDTVRAPAVSEKRRERTRPVARGELPQGPGSELTTRPRKRPHRFERERCPRCATGSSPSSRRAPGLRPRAAPPASPRRPGTSGAPGASNATRADRRRPPTRGLRTPSLARKRPAAPHPPPIATRNGVCGAGEEREGAFRGFAEASERARNRPFAEPAVAMGTMGTRKEEDVGWICRSRRASRRTSARR
jgi:hypothetical protein